ncbi:MAG: hypothetical protein KJO36_05760 [Acidimicrobiia bacterium]|nr:hypothetical protein [Acidimicrobiia bacterium]
MGFKPWQRLRKSRLAYGQSALIESSLTLSIIGTLLLLLAMITTSVPAIILGFGYLLFGVVGVIIGYLRLRKQLPTPRAEAVNRDGYWHRYSLK